MEKKGTSPSIYSSILAFKQSNYLYSYVAKIVIVVRFVGCNLLVYMFCATYLIICINVT